MFFLNTSKSRSDSHSNRLKIRQPHPPFVVLIFHRHLLKFFIVNPHFFTISHHQLLHGRFDLPTKTAWSLQSHLARRMRQRACIGLYYLRKGGFQGVHGIEFGLQQLTCSLPDDCMIKTITIKPQPFFSF